MKANSFPIGRVLIIGVELFALIMINLMCYFVFWNSSNNNSNNPYAITERSYEAYPVFSGYVSKIEVRNTLSDIIEAEEGGWQASSDNYAAADYVEIGVERLNSARIEVSNVSGSRWFEAGPMTYVYDSVCDNCGNIKISKNQKVNFVYDERDSDYYTNVIAIKGSANPFAGGLLWFMIIPSVLILVFSIVLMNAVVKKKADGEKRHNGAIAVSVVMIVLSAIFAFGVFGVGTYLKKASQTTYRVRAHAPVIYIYGNTDEYVNLKLDLNGDLTCTYPEYDPDEGWTVSATPDGILTDRNGDDYRFLFWEADLDMDYDLDHGFCIRGCDTEAFLDDALEKLGMNDQESADFKGYWLPFMENNEYNVITFQTDAYTDAAKLVFDTEPDVEIRVNMLWYASDEYVEIQPQELSGMNPALSERHGLVVSEWGGEVIPKP